MHLAEIQLAEFRNFPELSLTFPGEGAVLMGANGSGKTNLLEAIHVLCTGRSHRDAQRTEMIRFGGDACHLRGVFAGGEDGAVRRATIGFGRDKRIAMTRDDQPVAALSAWLGFAAVLSFGPDDVHLVSGLPRERRRFLDMLICQLDPDYLDHLMRYRRALVNRNRLLAGPADALHLDACDEVMAGSGRVVARRRREIATFLAGSLSQLYREICGERETGTLTFRASVEADPECAEEWKNVFFQRVASARSNDLRLGFSTTGPHRDDLVFHIDGRAAREYGSRGQCRSLALALRLSAVLCAEHFMRRKMIFLVDDAFSELDHERVGRILPLLENRGQIFVATPVPVPLPATLPRFLVAESRVTSA